MRPLRLVKNYHYFESQEEDEKVIMITRKHWLMLVLPFIVATFSGALLIYFFWTAFSKGELMTGKLDSSAKIAFALLVVLYVLLVAFGSWLTRYLNVLILTNKHIVDVNQKAFFARSVSTLELKNIEDVCIDKNGFFATIFDYGNIKIQTAGELPNFELSGVADPEKVQRTIMEAKEQAKGRR